MTRILIADHHAIVYDGLRGTLQGTAGLWVAGETVGGDEVSRISNFQECSNLP